MPVISLTMGTLPKETKKKLIHGLTEKAQEITNLPTEHFIVTINELAYDSLGLGGQTIEELRAKK